MLCLQSRTQDTWLQRAIEQTEEILIDHAHCERKAATNALNLLARYPQVVALHAPMLALAREELEHFELVLQLMQARNITMHRQAPTGYQAKLFALVRPEPDKLMDLLLVAALIEARSCERFRLLSQHHPDPDLRNAFAGLLESEARHHGTFVRLAEQLQPDPGYRDQVRARLHALAEAECQILQEVLPLPRIHA